RDGRGRDGHRGPARGPPARGQSAPHEDLARRAPRADRQAQQGRRGGRAVSMDRAKGLRARRRNNGQVMIDLTPLIDVVFQLLIFFILTTTFETNPAFQVKLPKANNAEVKQEPKAVVVTVTA